MTSPKLPLKARKKKTGQSIIVILSFCCIYLMVTLSKLSNGTNANVSRSTEEQELVPERGLSPFFSVKPLTKSLHPHHKLWIEMDEKEQNAAMDRVGEVIRKYGAIINPEGKSAMAKQNLKLGDCTFLIQILERMAIPSADQNPKSPVILLVSESMMILALTSMWRIHGSVAAMQVTPQSTIPVSSMTLSHSIMLQLRLYRTMKNA